jgi:hypothetical protein
MTDDLVKMLRDDAKMQLSVDYDTERAAMFENKAADRIEELQRELADANARIEYLEEEIVDLGYEMREIGSRQ